jgi:FkbM family methyltransferase
MYFLQEGSANTDNPHFERIAPSSTAGKYRLFFPEIGVAKWFYESGIAEKSLITWVEETFIKSDKVFIDVGAHVGTYSWICGKKAKHTYAFECSPTTFCYLAANVALHGLTEKISPFPFALGNAMGSIDYYVRSSDGGGNGVCELSAADKSCKKLKVLMKTLDSFEIADVGFIKIDVEGFEKSVLEGSVETLRKSNYPPILFESWGSWKDASGVNATQIQKELFAYLSTLGYKVMPVRSCRDMYLATHGT